MVSTTLPTRFSLRGLLGLIAVLAVVMNWIGLTLAGHWETAYAIAVACGAACTLAVMVLRDLSPTRLALLGVYFIALWVLVASWMTTLLYQFAVKRLLTELDGLGQSVVIVSCAATLPAVVLAILGLYREISVAYWDYHERRRQLASNTEQCNSDDRSLRF